MRPGWISAACITHRTQSNYANRITLYNALVLMYRILAKRRGMV